MPPSPTRFALLIIVAAALLVPAASADAATSVSSNWAGYVATPTSSATKFKTVSGTWIVPQGDCSLLTTGYSAAWVGIGGYKSSSHALEQIGTEFDCVRGTAKYSAWYELVPDAGHDISMTVRPGDKIDAAVTVKGTRVTVYLRNRTLGKIFQKTSTMKSPDTSSADWIVEAPSTCNDAGLCAQLPISNFGTIAFAHASATTAKGTKGSISDPHWSNTEITLSQGGGRFARFDSQGAQPSALSPDGTGFTVAYAEQAPSDNPAPPIVDPGAGVPLP